MPKQVVHAACPHDCPDACSVLITVEDGRATKLQGDPKHPTTRGFLCAKVAKYLDRVYSADRVLHPMRRIAPKRNLRSFAPSQPGAAVPTEAFRRITWDEALTEISSRFKKISSEFGSEAILPYSFGGTLGTLNFGSMDRRFFTRLGASELERAICSAAGEAGIESVYGTKLGTDPEQFAYSKYIIAWASNIHGNNVHLWPFIVEARRKGAKLVVIDPYRTRTAACADWYIPINPGTDVVLAMAMMQVIFSEGLEDADYLSKYTIGHEELREKVKPYSPEVAARFTGIPAKDIRRLALEYATTRPAVIRLNYGVQRSENGGMATRAVTMLPLVIGSFKEVGGGLQMSTSGAFGLNKIALTRPDLAAKQVRCINMVELGQALNELDDPPVKALFVYNSNPAAVAPNHNAVIRGLQRKDLFTVVHEQFFTDTTDYADIVLPATTFFEHKDLQTAYGHYYLQVSDQAIEPLGECRSNVEVFRALAHHMGFTEDCFLETVDQMIDGALDSSNPWLKGLTRERLEHEGPVRLNFGAQDEFTDAASHFLPFAHGNFRTPSGRALIRNESLQALGLDPVIAFTPPSESRHGSKKESFPLELLARKADNFMNSTFADQPSIQQMEELDILEMHFEDACARKIANGDDVRVFNHRGEIFLQARVSSAPNVQVIQPGAVCARLNWAKLSPGLCNINVLTSEKLSDLGNSATFYSVLVEVEPVKQ